MATLVDPQLTPAGRLSGIVTGASAPPTVLQRRRVLRRRMRAAVLRDWLTASAVGGFAITLVAVTLFSLIAH